LKATEGFEGETMAGNRKRRIVAPSPKRAKCQLGGAGPQVAMITWAKGTCGQRAVAAIKALPLRGVVTIPPRPSPPLARRLCAIPHVPSIQYRAGDVPLVMARRHRD